MHHDPLTVFVSSSMDELADERRLVHAALSEFHVEGWLWEEDAGARPDPIRTTYLDAVKDCDIYLGVFWLRYGPYTIEEFECARQHGKPCLVYEKRVGLDGRESALTDFLKRIQQVDSADSLTICWFETGAELAKRVKEDIARVIADDAHAARRWAQAEVKALKEQSPNQQLVRIAELRTGTFPASLVLPVLQNAYHAEADATIRHWIAIWIGQIGGEMAFDLLTALRSWEETRPHDAGRLFALRGIDKGLSICREN